MEFDTSVFQSLFGRTGISSSLDFAGIFFASYLPYFLLIALVVFFIFERNWRMRMYKISLIGLTILLSRSVIAETIRFFFNRERPPGALSIQPLIVPPDSFAFPSGHASVFFGIAMALFLLNRKWGIWFFASALVMGIARIFVGVHWPTDIIAGALVGILSAVIIWKLLPQKRMFKEKNILASEESKGTLA